MKELIRSFSNYFGLVVMFPTPTVALMREKSTQA
jgi:hypothetical protein